MLIVGVDCCTVRYVLLLVRQSVRRTAAQIEIVAYTPDSARICKAWHQCVLSCGGTSCWSTKTRVRKMDRCTWQLASNCGLDLGVSSLWSGQTDSQRAKKGTFAETQRRQGRSKQMRTFSSTPFSTATRLLPTVSVLHSMPAISLSCLQDFVAILAVGLLVHILSIETTNLEVLPLNTSRTATSLCCCRSRV
jgi:hypothetical protein